MYLERRGPTLRRRQATHSEGCTPQKSTETVKGKPPQTKIRNLSNS